MHVLTLLLSLRRGLELDKLHQDMKWHDTVTKEINIMKDCVLFKPIGRDAHLYRNNAWKYSPFH